MLRTYKAAAFDPERQREAPGTHEEDAPRPQAEGSFGEPDSYRRFGNGGNVFSGAIGRYFLGGANNSRDLHVKRRHRGRLVDVASLGMSVVDRHRRMEGGEELWCSWKREKRKEIQFVRKKNYCHVNSFPPRLI